MAKFWFNTVETVRRTYRCTIDDDKIEEALEDVDRTDPDAVKDAIHALVRENMWDDYTFEEEYDSDTDEATPEWDDICICAYDYIEDEDSKQTLGEIE